MKILSVTSISCIKKCFKRFPKYLCIRHCYCPNTLLSQIVNKVQVKSFHYVSKASTAEWHRINDVDFLKLSKLIADTEKDRLQTMVMDIQYTAGKNLSPEFISTEQLQQLYKTETRTQRYKFLFFLFKKERLKIAAAEKKEKKKAEKEIEQTKTSKDSDLTHGMAGNSLLIRVRPSSIRKFYNKRLANAVLFGTKIVLDLDYDQHMSEKERKACVAQLRVVYSLNRRNAEPFDLYFCNANPDATCVQYLIKGTPTISDSLVSLTKQNYLDIFPKENLVYLSPHAKETLKEFDPNAVYVIGAFVDTVKREHLSLHKADSEGIKSYSLPLDDYIMWGAGTKCLTINQVFEIMLTLKNTGDWIKAFGCIPTRKIRRLDPLSIETQNLPNKIFLTNTSNKT